MTIEKKDIGDIRVIVLCPRIDIHNVFDVEEQITGMIDDSHTKVIIDFKDVEYFGSNGIRILMLAKRKLEKMDGKMILASLNSFVIKILKAIDLIDIFTIKPNEEEAIKELS